MALSNHSLSVTENMKPHRDSISRSVRYCAATLLTFCMSICYAADYRVENLDHSIKVDSAGKRVVRVDLAIKLMTDAAIARFGQYALSYNSQLQKLDIERAETLHEDGSRVPVDFRGGMFDRPTPVTISAPQFSNEHLRLVTFPALSKGDTIRLAYTLTDVETLFPGKFSVQFAFPPIEEYRSANITLDTPADMPVAIDARGVKATADSTGNGRRIRSYHYETPASGIADEQTNTVAWTDIGPSFIATNFTGYADIASAYNARAYDKSGASDAVRALADQLTAGVDDRREQAKRLYAWVARNIRYVGVYFGAGPVVPHRAEDVLANRYGDCKDQVTLLSALLAAKGIDSDGVLVNLGNHYRLPDAPDVLTFNHVVAWLPEFGAFVDTTAGVLPFGVLPFEASDKPALNAKTGKILHTPPQNGTNSTSSVAYAVDIGQDGNGTLTGDLSLDGQAGLHARQMFMHLPPRRIADTMLRKFGLAGDLQLNPRHLDDLDAPLSIDMRGKIDQVSLMPGPAAVSVPLLPNFGAIRSFADYVLQQRNKPFDGMCSGTRLEERYRITLPGSVEVLAIPPNVDVRAGEIAYRSTYLRTGQTVDVTRVLERKLASNVCGSAKLAEWADAATAISTDLKRQILYR